MKCSDCGAPNGEMLTVYGVELRILCPICCDRVSDGLRRDGAAMLDLLARSKRQAQNRLMAAATKQPSVTWSPK